MNILSIKSNYDGQDGAFVTALTTYCLKEGILDAVVVVGANNWKPYPFIATKPEDILKASKSKYSISPNNKLLEYATENYDNVGLVGVPCQILGGNKFDLKMKIGLFCTKNFPYDAIKNIVENLGIPIDRVEKMNISKGKFIVETSEIENLIKKKEIVKEIPIKEIEKFANPACRLCCDFSAEYADISVGSVGSEEGWNTVIIRNDNCKKIIDEMHEKGLIEIKLDVDVDAIQKLENIKKKNQEINRCSAYYAVCPYIF
jgi:coenzyme F420 hydrogenase subunit beta